MATPTSRAIQTTRQIDSARRASKPGTLRAGYIVFALAHIPLALMMERAWPVSAIHALLTFAVGMWWAASDAPLERVALIGAYISGAEVLWRMTEAYQLVFWEFGKYALIAILVTAMLRTRTGKLPILPFLYFAFLLPSISQSISRLGLAGARGQVSFNLSGPAALLVSAWFFSNVRLSLDQVKRLLFVLIVPVLGIVSITMSVLLSSRTINWYLDSNTAITGGFGPNQVSAMLGLGWLTIWVSLLFFNFKTAQRVILIAISSLLLAASLLSFSRGGAMNAIVPFVFALGFSLTMPRLRQAALIQMAIAIAVVALVLLPRIEAITDGAFSTRFTDTSSTGRDSIAQTNWDIFVRNPIWGVGPGVSRSAAILLQDRDVADLTAHTEYTRLLAEHGMLGTVSLFLMGLMSWQNLVRKRTMVERGIIGSMIIWALVFMTHSAMRIAAVSFLFGLSFVIPPPPDLSSESSKAVAAPPPRSH